MGVYSEADRLKYLEGDSKAFSFFKVDTIEEQSKSKAWVLSVFHISVEMLIVKLNTMSSMWFCVGSLAA